MGILKLVLFDDDVVKWYCRGFEIVYFGYW
jgi:hypothetical protein